MYSIYLIDKTHQSLENEGIGTPKGDQGWNLVNVECGMFFLRVGWEQWGNTDCSSFRSWIPITHPVFTPWPPCVKLIKLGDLLYQQENDRFRPVQGAGRRAQRNPFSPSRMNFCTALMGSTMRTREDRGPLVCTQLRGQLAGGSMRGEHRVPDDTQAPSVKQHCS